MNDQLSTCRACEKEVSVSAQKCPHCGEVYPDKDGKAAKSTGKGCLIAAAILVAIWLIITTIVFRGCVKSWGLD